MHSIIFCKNNTVFAKSDFWSKIRQPAPVSPTYDEDRDLKTIVGLLERKMADDANDGEAHSRFIAATPYQRESCWFYKSNMDMRCL